MHFTITTGAGDSIEIHTEKQTSSSRIDVTKAGEAAGGNPIKTNVLVHGIYSVCITLLLSHSSHLPKITCLGYNNYSIYNNIYIFFIFL